MFIFANFLQKVNFERSQFQRVAIALAKFYLFELPLLRVLGETCLQSSRSSVRRMLLPLKYSFLLF